MGAHLQLWLLGEMRAHVEGIPIEGLRSGRARGLLAYLVLQPGVAHPRQRLASTFWPESSDAQARTNLRNVLHTLRRVDPAVDAAIIASATTLQWRRDPTVVVDVDEFVASSRVALESDPDEAVHLIERCREAVRNYGGDLLTGEQDDWLISRRDELRDLYRHVLRLLVTALIDDDRGGEALGPARALVRADPFDEAAHRLRIEAHRAADDRAGAVRAFHECATILERELGLEPSTATRQALDDLLDRPPAAKAAANRTSASVRGGQRLVGRSAELDALMDAWTEARAGTTRLVVVTGEAGIGKTRLVDEMRSRCLASGAVVGDSRSYEREGELGYAVAASWLRSPDFRAVAQTLAAGPRSHLSRLLPELGTEPPTESDADEASRRRQLVEAIVEALTRTGRPILLIADDAQWSDSASQELILYLLRRSVEQPVLVVLTARSEDLDAAHPVMALRDAAAMLDRGLDVDLGRLTPSETAELGGELIGSPLDAAVAETLHAESEGSPLFVVESIRAGWNGTGPARLTPKLRAVIESRFRRLSDNASTVMSVAAVVGRAGSASLLGRLSGLHDQALAIGLDELWQRGILREIDIDAYDFSHAKLRDAAYDSIPPATRRTIHSDVADALVALSDRDGPPAAGLVAFHHLAANRLEEAISWFQRAADDAYRVHAYVEAMRSLDQALDLVPSLPPAVRHHWELELLSIAPAMLAGVDGYGTERMHRTHRRAIDGAADLGVELQPAFVRSMVMSALCRDEFAVAADMAGQLASQAEPNDDQGLLVESHYLRGISAFWAADLPNARRHFESAVAQFDDSTRRQHHVRYGHDPQVVCLSRLANTMWFLGEEDLAAQTSARAVELAESVAHPLSHDTAIIFACVLAVDLADHIRLRELEPRLGALGMDSVPHAVKHQAVLGLLEVVDGHAAKGLERIASARERCGSRNFYPGFRMTVQRLMLAAHAAADDPRGGLVACCEARDLRSTPLWDAEVHRLQASFLGSLGSGSGVVEAELAAGEAIARRQGAEAHLRSLARTRKLLSLR